MKTNLLFIGLFAVLIVGSMALGSYDAITPAVGHSEVQLAIGDGWTTGIDAAFGWTFKLALGGVFAGFGAAAFNEARKAYKLWMRSAQAGRWTAGPNANFQRSQQPVTPKFSKQDMLLLALSGRLPQGERPAMRLASASGNSHDNDDEDDLDIQL